MKIYLLFSILVLIAQGAYQGSTLSLIRENITEAARDIAGYIECVFEDLYDFIDSKIPVSNAAIIKEAK